MTTTEPPGRPDPGAGTDAATRAPAGQQPGRRSRLREHSELGVSLLLLALGALVLTDALTMDVDISSAGPSAPRPSRSRSASGCW